MCVPAWLPRRKSIPKSLRVKRRSTQTDSHCLVGSKQAERKILNLFKFAQPRSTSGCDPQRYCAVPLVDQTVLARCCHHGRCADPRPVGRSIRASGCCCCCIRLTPRKSVSSFGWACRLAYRSCRAPTASKPGSPCAKLKTIFCSVRYYASVPYVVKAKTLNAQRRKEDKEKGKVLYQYLCVFHFSFAPLR